MCAFTTALVVLDPLKEVWFFATKTNLPMVPNVFQCSPEVPLATKLNPMDEPTMLCVPEMGSLRNVAMSSQMALDVKALKHPSINSTSESS